MLRVVEQFNSIQGEGPRAGIPTHFIRFAGCNLRCPGWPCDTQYAIDPTQYSSQVQNRAPIEVFQLVRNSSAAGVCLTGGEPFLQRSHDLECLLDLIKSHTGKFVEVFTNGTVMPEPKIINYIDSLVIDWKLPGSGESGRKNVWTNYIDQIGRLSAIKFTIKDRADYEAAREIYWTRIYVERNPVVFVGPVWGAIEVSELVKWMIEDGMPWRLNVQVHKYIWSPDTKGV